MPDPEKCSPECPFQAAGKAQSRRSSAHIVVEDLCDVCCMPRPLRRDFPGAIHHVFVRGNARSVVAVDAVDHQRDLLLLERAVSRFELICHAWCYLPNHSHLLVTSQLGNLSRAMHWLGDMRSALLQPEARTIRPSYQGRFGSRLVDDDAHFLELARYLRSTLCARNCVARRTIGLGRATRLPQVFGRCRGSSTQANSSECSAPPSSTSPGSHRASMRPSSTSGAFGNPSAAVARAFSLTARMTRSRSRTPMATAKPNSRNMSPRAALRYAVDSLHILGSGTQIACLTPECASTLARRRWTQHEALQVVGP